MRYHKELFLPDMFCFFNIKFDSVLLIIVNNISNSLYSVVKYMIMNIIILYFKICVFINLSTGVLAAKLLPVHFSGDPPTCWFHPLLS